MNTKYNTEEIMMLIPDYITVNISSSDKALVEKALSESAELTELYMDMKSSVGFIDSVKQEEPAPQYWNTLLPRIHEKIEERQNKGFSWEKLSVVWKVLVPVAAVILIALVYYIVKPSNVQLTEDKKIEHKLNDTTGKQNYENNQQEKIRDNRDNLVKDNETPEKIKDEIKYRKSVNKTDKKNENLVKGNTPEENKETPRKELINDEQITEDIDVEETAVFASGSAAGLDEDTENELKELNSTEKEKLLEELLNSNL